MGRAVVRVGAGASFVTDGWAVVRAGVDVRVNRGATLRIGDGVYINERARIHVETAVTIGAGSGVSWDVVIVDTDLHPVIVGGDQRPMRAPVSIGEGVWVGARCVITKGVTIGDGAVIGAGSVVTRDLPAHCLAVGAPARVVHDDVEWWP
jgi:acetyltransferase-like isoleucine patch superfamily enzyme